MKGYLLGLAVVALSVSVVRCGGSSSKSKNNSSTPSGQGYSYSSTSNKGDYAEWTFSGTQLSAKWQKIDSDGAILMTMNVIASCDTYDSKYNYFTCSISSQSTCTDGKDECGDATPSGTMQMMEVPGVAIFVNAQADTDSQLHIGMLKDNSACSANVSGDYLFTHTALGSKELVGIYRSDDNFENITQAEFGLDAANATTTPLVQYMSGNDGTVTFSDNTCADGVRSRSFDGKSLRSMITQSGIFVLDLPAMFEILGRIVAAADEPDRLAVDQQRNLRFSAEQFRQIRCAKNLFRLQSLSEIRHSLFKFVSSKILARKDFGNRAESVCGFRDQGID